MEKNILNLQNDDVQTSVAQLQNKIKKLQEIKEQCEGIYGQNGSLPSLASTLKDLSQKEEGLRNNLFNTIELKTDLIRKNTALSNELNAITQREQTITKVEGRYLDQLIGYKLVRNEKIQNHKQDMVLLYGSHCYVRFCVDSSRNYELLEIVPHHPKFEEIKEFLKNTQDTAGLLAKLRKYFAFCMENGLKKEAEQTGECR